MAKKKSFKSTKKLLTEVSKELKTEIREERKERKTLNAIVFLLIVFVISFSVFSLILFGNLVDRAQKIQLPSVNLASVFKLPQLNFTLLNSKKTVETFDPYELALKIKRGQTDYLLIDIRSPEEYQKEHIKSAINVPLYVDVKTMTKTIEFKDFIREVKEKRGNKTVIVYGHFSDSQGAKEATAVLSSNGVPTFRLSIGWNEWRHFTNLWVPEAEWDDFDIDNYIVAAE
jgi:rhodanese-related sulfurtransferase